MRNPILTASCAILFLIVAAGGLTRLTGFAVGNSKAELDGWSTSTPTSFTADFFFGYDPNASGLPVGSYISRAGQQVHQDTDPGP